MNELDRKLGVISECSLKISRLIQGELRPEQVKQLTAYQIPKFLDGLESSLDAVQMQADIIDNMLMEIQQLIEDEDPDYDPSTFANHSGKFADNY